MNMSYPIAPFQKYILPVAPVYDRVAPTAAAVEEEGNYL